MALLVSIVWSFPDQNTVVAINSESLGKADTMNIVWNVLWPELNRKTSLRSNPAEIKNLKRLNDLHYDPPQYVYASDQEEKIETKPPSLMKNDLGIDP